VRFSAATRLAQATRGGVLAVGASVMLAAKPQLVRRLGARVDAAVGRQPAAILKRLAAYRAKGALPPAVVVQIGDNGPLWSSDTARLKRLLAGVPHVVLVTVREATSWEGEVNDQLAQAVHGWPQASIADWQAASADASGLTYDGEHPNPAGATVYADAIARALAG
jgi:hypothetical protein